jgi:hypothetical protein
MTQKTTESSKGKMKAVNTKMRSGHNFKKVKKSNQKWMDGGRVKSDDSKTKKRWNEVLDRSERKEVGVFDLLYFHVILNAGYLVRKSNQRY